MIALCCLAALAMQSSFLDHLDNCSSQGCSVTNRENDCRGIGNAYKRYFWIFRYAILRPFEELFGNPSVDASTEIISTLTKDFVLVCSARILSPGNVVICCLLGRPGVFVPIGH